MKKYLIISILFLFSVSAMAQTAGFTFAYDGNKRCTPATVRFTNTSTSPGTITSYDWDFGDGSTHGNTSDPVHVFQSAGTYTVTLTVNWGGTQRTATAKILVTDPLKPTFVASKDTICPGETITFTSSIVAPGNAGGVRSYTWSMGDGGQSSQANPSWKYQNAGNIDIAYDVTLTIVDTNGCETMVKDTSAVFVWAKPIAEFGSTDTIFCYNDNQTTGTTTFINMTSGDVNNVAYKWIFGDGSTSTDQNPTKTFNLGNHAVTLIATSSHGCIDTMHKDNFIQMINFIPTYTYSDSILCKVPATLRVQGTNIRGTQYHWLWGDGREGFSSNGYLDKRYTEGGDFNVIVEATHPQGCTAKDTFTVHVFDYNDITVIPDVDDTNDCDPAHPIYFKNGVQYRPGSNTTSDFGFGEVKWVFGDGTVATGDSVSHLYPNYGDYDAQMIVKAPFGCQLDTAFFRVHIVRMKAVAVVTQPAPPNPPHGCAPHTVELTNIPDSLVSSSPITDFIWYWDYRDYNADGNQEPDTTAADVQTHEYQDTGIFEVRLRLINEQGCHYDVYINTIQVGYPPICGANYEFKADCKSMIGLNVTAHDSLDEHGNLVAKAYANGWTWIDPATQSPIGDGDTASLGYSGVGFQGLVLSPTHNGCTGSGPSLQNVCFVCPPVVAFDNPKDNMDGTHPEYCEFPEIHFAKTHDKCQGTRYFWKFGDCDSNRTIESTSDTLLPTDKDPIFQYSDTGGAYPGYLCELKGVIMATLWAENDEQWNMDSIVIADNVTGLPVDTLGFCPVCTDQTEQIFYISAYNMNFTTDRGSKNVYVCAGDSIKFWDSTEVLNCTPLNNWGFMFIEAADNSVPPVWPLNEWVPLQPYVKPVASSEKNQIDGYWMKFYYPNTYTVVMQDTSSFAQCIYNDTLEIRVYPQSVPDFTSSRTNANFYLGRDTLCANNPDSLHLRDASFTNWPFDTLEITGWKWIVGRDTAYGKNPIIVDTLYGMKDLELTVTNEFGCDSTITVLDYVLVNGIIPSFKTLKKTYCNKEPISFQNTSDINPRAYNQNTIMKCTWDFGDGTKTIQYISPNSSSADKYITHAYDLPNVSNKVVVSLTVESEGFDCQTTITDTLTINRPIADFSDDGHNYPCIGVGKNITFYDQSQGDITYYEWHFGDKYAGSDSVAVGENMDTVRHVYTVASSFDVRLIVTDDQMCTDTLLRENYVFIDGPSGDITYSPFSGCVNLQATFQPTVLNTDSVVINPDGETEVIRSGIAVNNPIRHTYRVGGAYVPYFYLIRWTNNNGTMERCVVEWSGKDTIFPIEMEPDFEIDSLYCPNVPITFINKTEIIPNLLSLDSARWCYTETSTDTITAIDGQTQYDSSGWYKVTMIGHSKLCAKTKTRYIEVMELPDFRFLPDTAKACDGLEVEFIADTSSYTKEQMSRTTNFDWTFNDGETYTGHPISREFTTSGDYIFDVDVTFTPQNCIIKYTDTVAISAFKSPTADFTSNPMEANAGETFNFTDASIQGDGVITNWDWDFGDEQTGKDQNPSHVFENTSGYITVTLVVTDEHGCKSTIQKQVLVTESMAFPNVLTPDANCEGEPCVFRPIEDKGFFKEFKMEIYDRWGMLIWRNSCTDPNCPSQGTDFWWDGRNRQGNRVSDGVYYWVIYGIPLSETNTIILNGSVTVMSGK